MKITVTRKKLEQISEFDFRVFTQVTHLKPTDTLLDVCNILRDRLGRNRDYIDVELHFDLTEERKEEEKVERKKEIHAPL